MAEWSDEHVLWKPKSEVRSWVVFRMVPPEALEQRDLEHTQDVFDRWMSEAETKS